MNVRPVESAAHVLGGLLPLLQCESSCIEVLCMSLLQKKLPVKVSCYNLLDCLPTCSFPEKHCVELSCLFDFVEQCSLFMLYHSVVWSGVGNFLKNPHIMSDCQALARYFTVYKEMFSCCCVYIDVWRRY